MSAINDRAATDPDVADRLNDLRLFDAFERYLGDSESVAEDECPDLAGPGEEEQAKLIRRMLRLGRDWGRGDTPDDALHLELFGILSRIKVAAYFQGFHCGYGVGTRRTA